jgi:hypothetical protein
VARAIPLAKMGWLQPPQKAKKKKKKKKRGKMGFGLLGVVGATPDSSSSFFF